jgi:hypothetical protein
MEVRKCTGISTKSLFPQFTYATLSHHTDLALFSSNCVHPYISPNGFVLSEHKYVFKLKKSSLSILSLFECMLLVDYYYLLFHYLYGQLNCYQ